MASPQHIIILPYFCQEEISRYLKIADRLEQFRQPDCGVHFLLASSPKIEPSAQLYKRFQQIAPCTAFACPSQVFGYPEGPTAMYWDAMEYVADRFGAQNGFCLWLESDMAPVKEDWLDRLSEEWFTGQRPLMMGCHVPDIYKRRLFRRPKLILHAHVNGGACYAMDFAKRLPSDARDGVFDMAVYRHAKSLGRIRETDQIAFSTLSRVRRDVMAPEKVLLHGFMQPKDAFVEQCLRPVTERERRSAVWHPVHEQLEQLGRKIRVQFVRRGHRAMLENMLLAKQKSETQQRTAPTL